MSVPRRATDRLERGETVGVVAPGYAVRPELLSSGVRRLERWGFRVKRGSHVLARDGYLAGSDEERAADLNAMLRDPEVRAIWFARGGYGTARLLDRLDWRAWTRDPKLLIGYSDLTALFGAVARRGDGVCIYGPVVTELGQAGAYHRPSLRSALAGRPDALRFRRRDVLASGCAEGPLRGGNLTVLTHLCGTRHFPDLRGAVLLLEDVGEPVYRIDRMLGQLRQARALRSLAGVALGALVAPRRRRFPGDRPLQQVIEEVFLPLGVPIVTGLPLGHVSAKRSVPLGRTARLDTERRRLEFLA